MLICMSKKIQIFYKKRGAHFRVPLKDAISQLNDIALSSLI